MGSVLGRYLVGPEARVEGIDLLLRLDRGLTGGDILAGDDLLTNGNIGLALDTDAKKQTECRQRRLW